MMGARNVSAAFSMWSSLPHGAFRLLVGMALQALDQASKEGRPPRVFFGGEDSMVELLGRSRRSVYEALAVLRERGAIEVLDAGRGGHRAVYKLLLDPTEDPTQGAESRTLQGADFRSTGCGISHTQGAESRTPRKDEGIEESRPGRTSPQETTSPAPVDNSGDGDFDYTTAQQIVTAALGIEAAATRIRELTADGTNYEAAMLTLAHQIGDTP